LIIGGCIVQVVIYLDFDYIKINLFSRLSSRGKAPAPAAAHVPVGASKNASASSSTTNATRSNSINNNAKVESSEAKALKQTRRRLSVMSDNKLIEGMDAVNLEPPPEEEEGAVPPTNFIVNSYGGYSKK